MKSSARLLAFGSMGLEFAAAVVVSLLIGMKIDDWLGSSPLGTVIGILLGTAIAIYRVLAYLKYLNRSSPTEDEEH